MIARALAAFAIGTMAGLITGETVQGTRKGFAPHYQPGLMESIARKRGLRASACMVASYDEPVGAWVRVTSRKSGRTEQCQVVDTCHPRDCRRLKRLGYVVELGFPAAKRLCGIRYYAEEPPRACPVAVRP